MQMNVPQSMVEFFSWVRDQFPDFRPFVVGGACRDHFIGSVSPKDFDFEVFGVSIDNFISCAHQRGEVQVVGVSFGVMKFRPFGDAEWHDVAFPRRESKSGVGHKGFIVDSDPFMSTFEASSRRDFTMNSIMFDIFNDEFVDHHNGISDIRQGIIRPVGKAFSDDAQRFFRGMSFASRFNMVMTQNQSDRSIVRSVWSDIPHVSKDRIRDEFVKICVKGVKPSMAFRFVDDCGFGHVFPEVFMMKGIQQDSKHHPEGDVFIHTMHVMDVASKIAVRENMNDDDRVVFVMSAICHDMGKISHTQEIDGKIVSHGHDDAGEPFARSFMERIGFVGDIVDKVVFMVKKHMAIRKGGQPSRKQVSRIVREAMSVGINPDMVWWIMEADESGRPPRPVGMSESVRQAMDMAHEMSQNFDTSKGRVQGIVNGDMIKSMGFKPSPIFKQIIDASVDAQAEGEFSDVDGACAWVSAWVQANGFGS